MPHSAIQLYMERLKKRQAEMRLMLGEAATVPHMDEDGRKNWSNEIEEILHGAVKPKIVSSPGMFKAIGIGVHKE
jgi:hypothetical protein